MKKKTGIAIVGVFVALLLMAVILGVALVRKYTPNKEYVAPEEVAPVAEGEAHIILWQQKYEKNALRINGGLYIDLDTVLTHINSDFYYDEDELVLTYTTPTEIIRAYPLEAEYYSNKTKKELSFEPVLTKGGVPYVSTEFVELFSDVTFTFYEKPDRLLIRTGGKDMLSLKAKKRTQVRESADIKSRIVCDLDKNAVVWYVDAGTQTSTKFVKVMTGDGIFGFVKKKDLSSTYHEKYTSDYTAPVYPHILEDGVVLGWHMVTNQQANGTLEDVVKDNPKITVISPTWFLLSEADAEEPILSLADAAYVEKAKSMGLDVWGLVANFDMWGTEGVATTEDCFEILSSTQKRETLINTLIAEAIRFNLDGLNIDFELLSLKTGPHFIQFLRELSVKCRANGLVLSVDNYVPSAHAAYYDWESQGEVVDYVVIMAYDEHYEGSETAGSVSSFGYVSGAVDNILTMVPKEQVIIAVPFYTRLWTETKENGVTKLTSAAWSMASMKATLAREGITPVWDEETKQNYAEYKVDNATCKIWLEDEDSLAAKLAYIYQAELAGVAVWRLGFETPEIWALFE